MTRQNQDFTIWIGETTNLPITTLDDAGAVVNITGATIDWVLKHHVLSDAVLITKATGGNGIVLTDPTNGVFTVSLTPTETEVLGHGDYYHEAEITDTSLNENVVMTGTATLLPSGVPI